MVTPRKPKPPLTEFEQRNISVTLTGKELVFMLNSTRRLLAHTETGRIIEARLARVLKSERQ